MKAVIWTGYTLLMLTLLGLGVAAVWTAADADVSTKLGGTAGVLVLGTIVGVMVGCGVAMFTEDL